MVAWLPVVRHGRRAGAVSAADVLAGRGETTVAIEYGGRVWLALVPCGAEVIEVASVSVVYTVGAAPLGKYPL